MTSPFESSPYFSKAQRREAGSPCVLKAMGKAKNKVTLIPEVPVYRVETDAVPRMPPGNGAKACDWLVLTTEPPMKGLGVELKGSDYEHAFEQLTSTLNYAKTCFAIQPAGGVIVFSGRHPAQSKPAWNNLKMKFKKSFGELTSASYGETYRADASLKLTKRQR